jgi:AcrR family transcriptional regulator
LTKVDKRRDRVEGTQRPKALGRKRDETRDPEILRAALDVLTETGYERMTMDAVAAKAKTGKATIYRRWASKAQLVVDAIASAGQIGATSANLRDTGSLRGDLLALAATASRKENSKILQMMTGLISALPHHPDLAAIVQDRLVAPRTAQMRDLLERAEARGEIARGRNLDTLALVAPAMTVYWLMIVNKPLDRAFYAVLVDEILLPVATGKPIGSSGKPSTARLIQAKAPARR